MNTVIISRNVERRRSVANGWYEIRAKQATNGKWFAMAQKINNRWGSFCIACTVDTDLPPGPERDSMYKDTEEEALAALQVRMDEIDASVLAETTKLQRLAEKFKEHAKKYEIREWNLRKCSMCGYQLKYVISEDYEKLSYDAGCYCSDGGLEPREWMSLAEHYDMQSNENYIKSMNEFWYFEGDKKIAV